MIVVDGRSLRWEPFDTDSRGAVISGLVTDYRGPQKVAYFHAALTVPEAAAGQLGVSTVDDFAVWVNGQFEGFIERESAAWWDFWTDDAHAGVTGRVPLRAGVNHVLVRVLGGVYASGGFYLRLAPIG